MNNTAKTVNLGAPIDTIERGYEYLLAFAAQGRRDEVGSEARHTLESMYAALLNLEHEFDTPSLQGTGPARAYDDTPFLTAVKQDLQYARGAIAHVLNCNTISSLLVDNLNASVHLRALLTDLFLLDQARTQ